MKSAMNSDFQFKFGKRKKLASLLGLTLDGGRLEGVVLKRTNGALQSAQSFSVVLTLDPLTAAPELVGREIRNQLDAAGIRERHCILGVPLRWVLTAQTELPPLPPADAASLLPSATCGFKPCACSHASGIPSLSVSSGARPPAISPKPPISAGS